MKKIDSDRYGIRTALLFLVTVFTAVAFVAEWPPENGRIHAAVETETDIDFDGIDADPEVAPPVTPAAAGADSGDGQTAPRDAPQDDSSGQDAPQRRSYLAWMFVSLGWFFAPVFFVLSIVTVALFVINILSIRREVLRPTLLVEEFGKLLDEKKYQDAYELAKLNDSLLGKVLSSGLAKMSGGYEQAVQAMQDVGEEETMRLESRLKYLALIGNIAPMLGLFGTVTGMIHSFQEIAVSVSTPPAYKLAEGISTALFTTEVGLAIAIPAIAFYDVMRTNLNRYVLEIGIASDGLMSRFKK